MKKYIFLIMITLFIITLLGCNKKTDELNKTIEETPVETINKDYYSCDDWKLYLEITDKRDYDYSFKLISKNNEYTGYAYTYAPLWNDENPIDEIKILYFDNLECYRNSNLITLAEVLDPDIWFTYEFSIELRNAIIEIINDANKNKELYVDFYFKDDESFVTDYEKLVFVVFSYDKELCDKTYNDIIIKIKEYMNSIKDKYPCYIDPNLPIFTENLIGKESELKQNFMDVTLNFSDMTFTYKGVLPN